jgi:hypothetical protein
MSNNEHFIRSRSFSGWTHTLLVSRATASPRKRHPGSVRLTLRSTTFGEPRFACGSFSPEKENARESVEACAK